MPRVPQFKVQNHQCRTRVTSKLVDKKKSTPEKILVFIPFKCSNRRRVQNNAHLRARANHFKITLNANFCLHKEIGYTVKLHVHKFSSCI